MARFGPILLTLLFFIACSYLSRLHQTTLQHPKKLPKACRGKESVLALLDTPKNCRVLTTTTKKRHVLGMTTCNVEDLCDQLPQYKQLKRSYGTHPIVSPQQHPVDPDTPIRVVGLPGTTEAVAHLLQQGDRVVEQQTVLPGPWNNNGVSVCVVRDPFRWMGSMVRRLFFQLMMRSSYRHLTLVFSAAIPPTISTGYRALPTTVPTWSPPAKIPFSPANASAHIK